MDRRLRAPLRGVGAKVRALPQTIGVQWALVIALVLLALSLFALCVAVLWWGVLSSREQTAEQEARNENVVPAEVQPEDIPLIFGPGPSPELAGITSTDRRRIPGVSEMQVIGYLQYLPGTDFRCPGGGPDGRGLTKRVCSSSTSNNPVTYEVDFLMNATGGVVVVVATASDASDEEASKVLGEVAKLTVSDLGPLDPEAWVDRTISSGGQYSTDGADVRLYGTEKTRTLEIVATVPFGGRGPLSAKQNSQTTPRTTGSSLR